MARRWLLSLCAAGTARSAAGVWLRAEQAADGVDGNATFPSSWDTSFGEKQVVMDAFIYPDLSAPDFVLAAAQQHCMRTPHVMMVGTNTKHFMAEEKLDKFSCSFHLPGGRTEETPGGFYPERDHACPDGGIPGKQYRGNPDHALVCEVPRALLKEDGPSTVEVVLLRRDNHAAFSNPIVARALGGGSIDNVAAGGQRKRRRYRLAVTNMYRNAGAHIVNWLEWHIAKGVEHFFLYDNGSDEEDRARLEPYERRGLVTRIQWTFCCKGPANNVGQRGALNHALMKFGQVSDWLISLDQDEFLVSPSASRSIPDILDETNSDKPGVAISYSIIAESRCPVESGSPEAVQLGSVLTSSACPPKLTQKMYPGKFFIRPSRAYDLGFLYTTPHPTQCFNKFEAVWSLIGHSVEDNLWTDLDLSYDTVNMTIAHFQRPDAKDRWNNCKKNCLKGGPLYQQKEEWLQREHTAFMQAIGRQRQ